MKNEHHQSPAPRTSCSLGEFMSAGEDSRYKHIIRRLEGMREKLQRQPRHDVASEVEGLLSVVLTLTTTEDVVMELVAFPHAAEHRRIHQSLCVHTAQLRYRSVSDPAFMRNLDEARHLWLKHIELHDRAFEAFLMS